MKEKLVLIDSMALIHRAFHAYPGLTTTDGVLVNSVYGFGVMFLQILKNIKPEHVVFTSDLKEKTVRHDKYEDYKANRAPMDEGLVSQLEIVYDFIRSTGLPLFTKNGYEADDIIASLATKYSNDYDVRIVTGDKDLLQILSDDIKVVLPGKSFSDMKIYTPEIFKERFGFDSINYIYYKALLGDAGDNIKGAKGIGEKTATDLIKEYYTLGGIYENLDKIKERYQKILNEYKDHVFENIELVEVHKDLDLEINEDQSRVQNFDLKSTIDFFKKYEFNSLITQIQKLGLKIDNSIVIEEKNKIIFTLNDDKKNEYVNFIKYKEKYICFDDNYNYQISNDIPSSGITFNLKTFLKKKMLQENNATSFDGLFNDVVENKIDNNLETIKDRISKYDDLQIMAYCMDTSFCEDYVVKLYKKIFHKNIDDAFEVSGENIDNQILLSILAFIEIKKKVKKEIGEKELNVYKNIDLPLVPIIAEMEDVGMKVDVDYIKSLQTQFDVKINELKKKIFETIGHEFNPNSTKELSHVLFEELGLPKMKKIKTGFSTNERTISKLIGVHPIIELILEYREYTKLQSTYVIGLQKLIVDGKIHTELKQAVVATGRLSSVNPNLQNIPTRSAIGEQIRKVFIADHSCLLLSMDYSQIELRLMAHISGDEKFIEAFKDAKDIHTNTASLMFNVAEEDVSSEQRRVAKMINFGIIYGISDFGLSDRLGNIDVKTAKEFIQKYFERYPMVEEYFEKIKKEVKENGYVETIFGRRRYFNIEAGNYMVKQAMYREAINMPIQGADADIVKMAMIKVQDLINKKYLGKVQMLLQIHDELLFQIVDDEKIKNDFESEAKQIMESIVELKVPMIVNIKSGINWGEMK